MTFKKPVKNTVNASSAQHAPSSQPVLSDGASPLSALTIQRISASARPPAAGAGKPRTALRASGLAAALFSVTLAACGQAGDTGNLPLADAHAQPQTEHNRQNTETREPAGAPDTLAAESIGTLPESGEDAGRSVLYSSPALKAVASNDICRSILSRNSLLVGGHSLHALPNTPRPRQGVATLEPTYGSCLVRLTNQSATRGRFHRNDYSRRQAFNADGSLMFLYAEDGFWHLYDAMTGKWLKVLKGLAGDAEPQWHPNNPHVLYFLPTNGVGMKIFKLDVIRNQVTLVADMGRQIRAHWPDASAAWTRSEGSPSYSARYWCLMVDSISGGQWRPRGVFTFDLTEKRIIATMNVQARPDHVSMSPSGNYCVISGDDRTGTRAYRRDFKAPYNDRISTPYLQLHHKSEHSDLAYNRRREDVYVSIDYQANRGDVFMVNLKTGEKTSLFPTYMNRTATAIHVSGKSFRKPGWALISTYGEHHASTPWQNLRHSAARQWPHRKIFAVSLEKNPKIRSLAYTHSDALSYWAEPHATVNLDFTRILFNSTWNSSNARDMEAFMLAIPKNALDRPTR